MNWHAGKNSRTAAAISSPLRRGILMSLLMISVSYTHLDVYKRQMLLRGIPPVAVYLLFQKYIVEGIATSGLKG